LAWQPAPPLVQSRRVGAKVRHQHVAGLGSIPLPPSPAGRIEFWTKLHQRLAALHNRIDAAAAGKIMASVHARIPMPTPADQRAVQLDNARADADFWERLHDMHAENIEGQKGLAAKHQRDIAEGETAVAAAAARAAAARDKLVRMEKGEDVPAIGKPLTFKDAVAAIGGIKHARRAMRVAEIDRLGGSAELLAEIRKRSEAAEKAAVREVLKRRRRGGASP